MFECLIPFSEIEPPVEIEQQSISEQADERERADAAPKQRKQPKPRRKPPKQKRTNVPPRAGEELDLIWGARNIALVLNKTTKSVLHLLEKKKIPGSKLGTQWVASRSALLWHILPGDGKAT